MARKPDGGPAFPKPSYRVNDGEVEWGQDGMSLSDWFAAQAIMGFIAARKDTGWGSPADLAKRAYEFADAMIAERDKQS